VLAWLALWVDWGCLAIREAAPRGLRAGESAEGFVPLEEKESYEIRHEGNASPPRASCRGPNAV
jgi:hypothetical protein